MVLLAPLLLISKKLILIALGFFGIGFIIAFHELGHFLFCKLFNISTPSFSIGFGPQLISKKIGETQFKLSAIPVGGYVEIAGSAELGQGDQKEAHSKDERSFASKPYYQKFLVMIGGIAFNLLFAYTAMILLFMFGMPKREALTTIGKVMTESPAQRAGLEPNDTITAINGIFVEKNVPRLKEELNKHIGEPIVLTVNRKGQQQKLDITVGSTMIQGKTVGTLGVIFNISDKLTVAKRLPFLDAIKQGIATTNRHISQTIIAFKNIFAKGDMNSVGGPILIISETIKSAGYGLKMFIFFLAIISISLAILNLIPLPILDGGQILFYTIEAIIRKPLSPKLREYIHIVTWICLLTLLLYLSYYDIKRIIQSFL